MEDVLDLYAEPYQAEYPTLCFDEFSYQLIREVRKPLQMQSGKPKRYDYEEVVETFRQGHGVSSP